MPKTKKSTPKPAVDEIIEESRREFQVTKLRVLSLLRDKMNPMLADLRALAPATNASPMDPHTRTWALRLGGQIQRLSGIFIMVDDGEETRFRDLDEDELRLAAVMGQIVSLLESFRFGPVPDDCGDKMRELVEAMEEQLDRLIGPADSGRTQIDPDAYEIMGMICDSPTRLQVQEIASAKLDRKTVAKHLKDLVAKGFVEYNPKRKTGVSATEKGRKFIDSTT